ncbi:MAG: glycosyltransferase [Phycisphaerae bacterium]|jgi:glycosyltransferase involved in cell wall biosynthesis
MQTENNTKNITVVLTPFDEYNPYLSELAGHLCEEGCRVITSGDLKDAYKIIIRGGEKVDVLHLHWLRIKTGSNIFRTLIRVFAYLARLVNLRRRGVKIVWTVHNMLPHETTRPRLELWVRKIAAKLANVLLVHSEGAKQQIVSRYKLKNSSKVRVIEHGNYIGFYPNEISKQQARRQLGIDEDKTVILCFGTLRPYKNVEGLIYNFANVAKDDAQLLVVGHPLSEQYGRGITDYASRYENVTVIAEYVPSEQVQVYMNACDAVVFAYSNSLTSGVALLAMSFGRACIAPRSTAFEEVLDEAGAFLFDPDDGHGPAETIRRTIAEREKLDAMGRYNYERAAQWDWMTISRKVLGVYFEVLGKKASERSQLAGITNFCD